MNKTAYIRVSTGKQTFDRQKLEFDRYFERMGIDPRTVKFVSEKITSHTSFRQRAIYPVLSSAKEGDIVYACQLDRLGRSMIDILELVNFATERGVTLIMIDNNMTIENRTPMGKLVLGVLSAMAETERELRAERCQAGIDAAREEIRKHGARISRVSGKVQTKWGNEKGCDMSAALAAANEAAANRKIQWRENSIGYRWVIDKIKGGMTRNAVIEEFNKLHELQPEVFCTPTGRPLSKGTLSHWLKDAQL